MVQFIILPKVNMKAPTCSWRTFSTRPIRSSEEILWLIQVGDDPEDYLIAFYDHENKQFLNGVTTLDRDEVIRFAKVNM